MPSLYDQWGGIVATLDGGDPLNGGFLGNVIRFRGVRYRAIQLGGDRSQYIYREVPPDRVTVIEEPTPNTKGADCGEVV